MLKSVGNPGEKAQIINKWLGKIKKWPELQQIRNICRYYI